MNKVLRGSVIGALLLAFLALVPASQAKDKLKTEDELVVEMSSPTEKIALHAMQDWEKNYPTGTKGLPVLKTALKDPRPAVHRKAARVLGSVHADVSHDDLEAIAAMVKSPDKQEATDGLKALRGLKAKPVVSDIEAALKYPDDNVKRDACRTLAVVGDKGSISAIEPLLQFPSAPVQKDAMDAIAALKAK